MRSDRRPENLGDRASVRAALAVLAMLCALALAGGMLDGAERPHGRDAAGGGSEAAPSVWAPCFRGPRGEPVDFAAVAYCPRPGAADGWFGVDPSR